MRLSDTKLFVIFTPSLITILAFAGYTVYGQEMNETTKIYESSDIGIRFEYPSYWGDVVQIGGRIVS